jgi:hypothetical protein
MQTELVTELGRYEHPPQPVHSAEAHPLRRVGPLDRTAMHLGVALIRWGRRPVRAHRERPARIRGTNEARQTLEQYRDQYLAMTMTQFR